MADAPAPHEAPPTEPPATLPGGPECWAGYLTWLRETMIVGVTSLDKATQRRSQLPSGWTPLELLSHVTHMEQRWFIWGFLGEDVAEPWGDWSVGEPWGDAGRSTGGSPTGSARWQVPDGVTADALAQQLRAIGQRTSDVLAAHPLSARASVDGRFTENPPTLEWICFHVLAEYARHAGHLDIARELATPQR